MPRVSIWEILVEAGFEHDPKVVAETLGMSLDLVKAAQSAVDSSPMEAGTSFVLQAGDATNRTFKPAVFLGGHYKTSRSLQEVQHELPLFVDSRSQGLALLAYCIPTEFDKEGRLAWLLEGRNLRDQLPWVQAQKVYERRPRLSVTRDWLRLALRSLRELLTKDCAIEAVEIGFDGNVLKIAAGSSLIALPAIGKAWPSTTRILTKHAREFPTRLMHDPIEFSIWEGHLHIANRTYPITPKAEVHPAKVPG